MISLGEHRYRFIKRNYQFFNSGAVALPAGSYAQPVYAINLAMPPGNWALKIADAFVYVQVNGTTSLVFPQGIVFQVQLWNNIPAIMYAYTKGADGDYPGGMYVQVLNVKNKTFFASDALDGIGTLATTAWIGIHAGLANTDPVNAFAYEFQVGLLWELWQPSDVSVAETSQPITVRGVASGSVQTLGASSSLLSRSLSPMHPSQPAFAGKKFDPNCAR